MSASLKPTPASAPRLDGFSQLIQAVQHSCGTATTTLAPGEHLDDPLGWVDRVVRFPRGGGLTAYQREILSQLVGHGRVCFRGPHSLGKTTVFALAVCWFADTRERAGLDWKILTTAGSWRQLAVYLWPEVHKWARLLDWQALGRLPWREGDELLDLAIKLRFGQATAVASNNPQLIEGAHADELLYLFDEAKAIQGATFDAAEGAFAGAGEGTDQRAYAMVGSTPGPPMGRFYEIQSRRPGTERWWVRAVSREECIAAGRVARDWGDDLRRLWGERSAVYQNRVLGNFAVDQERGLIPLTWIEAANERWLAWQEAGSPGAAALTSVGVDVGRTNDRTVLAPRAGQVITALHQYGPQRTTVTAGQVITLLRGTAARATIDVIGIGAGVVDMVQEAGCPVLAFNASAAAVDSQRVPLTDRSGQLTFANLRAAAWWSLRERLDPDTGDAIALPPNDDLTGELTAPTWTTTGRGHVLVESKDDVAKRLDGRSTDTADAVVMAYWDLASAPPAPLIMGAVRGW